jgi:hypothetical protein
MKPAEVIAIEIRQFTGSNVTTLVPTVFGQTAQAAAQRGNPSRGTRQWDWGAFFEALKARKGEQISRIAERLLQWSDSVLPVVWWGNGNQDGSCFRGVSQRGKDAFLFAVWTNGRVELQFQWLKRYTPFDSESARIELLRRINETTGVNFGPDATTRRPSFDLALLSDPHAEESFHGAVQWAAEQIRNA